MDTLDRYVRLPARDTAGVVGFVVMVAISVAILTRIPKLGRMIVKG